MIPTAPKILSAPHDPRAWEILPAPDLSILPEVLVGADYDNEVVVEPYDEWDLAPAPKNHNGQS